MSDLELIDAVAKMTGEDAHEIRRRGFTLTGPDDTGPEPECLLNVMLVDLDELRTIDWPASAWQGCMVSRQAIPVVRIGGPRRYDVFAERDGILVHS